MLFVPGVERSIEVVDLVCDHVDEILKRGQRSWLDDDGIQRGFSSH